MTEQTTRTLELVKVKTAEATYQRKTIKLPTYEVRLDGELIGTVERGLLTRERRTRGNRYVNARWQSPGWRYRGPVGSRGWRSFEAASRKDGVYRLLRDRGLSFGEAETLAATMKVVER